MPFGVTDEGFVLKRLPDILNDYAVALADVQDPITGESLTPDLTDENDPLVQIVNATADALAEAWEQLQLCYNQFDPLKAVGAGLGGLVQLNALRRLPGTYSTDVFTCTGTPGITVPAGQRVTDEQQQNTYVLPEFAFSELGVATVVGTCTEKGPVSSPAGAFVSILTPVANWAAVTNAGPNVIGTHEETDAALRYRQRQSTAHTGASLIDNIYSSITAIAGVSFCRVYQNRGLVADARGIPGKAVAAVVVGGEPVLITEALFHRVPLGVEPYGTTSVDKYDTMGMAYAVAFSRPTAVPVYVSISISITHPNLWSALGLAAIEAYILQYALTGAAAIGIDQGFDRNGYIPGDSVYASELYVPVLRQSGIRINSLLVGTNAPAGAVSVAIAWNQIAEFASSRISIVVA